MVIRVLHQSPAPTLTFHLLLSPPVTSRQIEGSRGRRKQRRSTWEEDEGLNDRGIEVRWKRKKRTRRRDTDKRACKQDRKERPRSRGKRGSDGWWMAVESGVGSGWLGVTAECKVPAAAVHVPTEGGCGVSGLFDYEYANATRHESKRNSESYGGRRRRRGEEWKMDRRLWERGRWNAFIFLLNVHCVFHWALFRHWGEGSVCLPCSMRIHNSQEH